MKQRRAICHATRAGVNARAQITKPAEAGWSPYQPPEGGFVLSARPFMAGRIGHTPRTACLITPPPRPTRMSVDARAHCTKPAQAGWPPFHQPPEGGFVLSAGRRDD